MSRAFVLVLFLISAGTTAFFAAWFALKDNPETLGFAIWFGFLALYLLKESDRHG